MSIRGPWLRTAQGAGLVSPDGSVQPTIFARMSALAAELGAVNLGQGAPDYQGPAAVLRAAQEAIAAGVNQYSPGRGAPVLLDAISRHDEAWYRIRRDPATEVLVTAGATEALAATVLALCEPGDEVVTFEPFYDAYGGDIALAGATQIRVPLRAPGFSLNLDDLRTVLSERTRLIIVNDPHNPSGVRLDAETRGALYGLAAEHDAYIVTDEVYEHLTFTSDHETIAQFEPDVPHRVIRISSGGKTFSTTGWKIGWITAHRDLIQAILAVKQFLTYVNGAPFQPAIAVGLELHHDALRGEAAALKRRSERLLPTLEAAGMRITQPEAGYFALADISALTSASADQFCDALAREVGVVAIPLTAFVTPERRDDYRSWVRFAFCKNDAAIDEAVRRISSSDLAGLGEV